MSCIVQLPKDTLSADLVLRLESEMQPLHISLACYGQVQAIVKIKLLTFRTASSLKMWVYAWMCIYILNNIDIYAYILWTFFDCCLEFLHFM